jgi:hypothetical protein
MITKEQFLEILTIATKYSEIARRCGLLALEDYKDSEKALQFDIFYLGLCFVVDGADSSLIREILDEIINQELDPDIKLLKIIQRESILAIQEGLQIEFIIKVTSLTQFTLEDTLTIPEIKNLFINLKKTLDGKK